MIWMVLSEFAITSPISKNALLEPSCNESTVNDEIYA